jgi:hypothetical protein
VDGVASTFRGRASVASVDVSDPAGAELGQKYGASSKAVVIVFFTRDGGVDVQAPTITEAAARMILGRLLDGK